MIKRFIFLFFISLFYYSISSGQSVTPDISWEDMMSDPSYSFKEIQAKFNERWADVGYIKDDGYKIFKRWEYMMEPIIDKNGYFDYKKVASEYVRYQQKVAKNFYRSSEANWEQLGPFGFISRYGIGRVNVVGYDHNDVNVLWLGAASGGLWKSTDGGEKWNAISDDYRMMGISDVEVDYNNSDIVYVATGDRDAGDTYTYGVFKSMDGGKTWDKTGFPDVYRITELLINPNDGTQLYASTTSGIFKTIDGGNTWQNILSGVNVKDMKTKPGDFNVIYATNTVSKSDYLLFYRSKNGGVDFEQFKIQDMPIEVNRAAIAVCEDFPNLVFLSAGENKTGWDGQDFIGIYKSEDSGDTFSELQIDNPPELGSQSWYDWTFTVSPDNPNELFAGGVRLFRSIDGGKNWVQSTNWSNPNNNDHFHVDHHYIGFQPGTNNLFVGCDGGVYKSTNKAKYWEALNDNLSITQYYKMGSSTSVEHLIIGGSQDNGTHLLNEGKWNRVMGGDGMDCGIDPTNPNIMYASYQLGNIRKSVNRGSNFYDILNENTTNEKGAWVTPIAIDPVNPNILYAGFESMWKSYDKGESWDKVSNRIEEGETIRQIEIAPSDDDVVYVSAYENMFKTVDGGNEWEKIKNPKNDFIRDIAVSPKDPDIVFVASRNNIFKSTDGGSTWININGTLPNVPKTTIAIQNNSIESIYLGTFVGVFYTDNTMSDWIPFNEGMPPVRVGELEVNANFGKLIAASYGRGFWETNLFDFNYDLPFCTTLTYPENDKRVVADSVTLKWNSSEKAEGYIISIGSQRGENDILDSLDVGNVLEYTWNDIGFEGKVFVSVTPYNSFGQATNCIDNSFIVGCAYDDKLALIRFYKATGGDNWTVKWDTTDCDLSNWYGVELDEDGRVTTLDFDGVFDGKISGSGLGNNLVGTLDSTIGDLVSLKFLYLAGNKLKGDLPGSFSKLNKLKEVDLSKNEFNGDFPKVLAELKLTYLNISMNKFAGEISGDLSKWNGMAQLLINKNEFTGKIPSSFNSLKSAWLIDISDNNFSGKFPYQFYFLKNLYSFNAENNKLSGKLSKRLASMKDLYILLLGYNQFEGSIPKEFGNKQWGILYINDNNLSGCFDNNLKKLCTQNAVINFSGNSGLPNNGDFHSFCSNDIGNCNKLPGCSDGFAFLLGGDSLSYNSPISWMGVDGAEGYRVSVGTTSKGVDIADNVDVSNNSYDAGELPVGKRIYVNIQAYNKYGSAIDCDELSFIAVKSSSVFEKDTISFGSLLSVYPVPAKDYIIIKKIDKQLGDISMSIVNIHGVSVMDKIIPGSGKNERISIESLTKGVYFLKMNIKSKEYYKKLIVQ